MSEPTHPDDPRRKVSDLPPTIDPPVPTEYNGETQAFVRSPLEETVVGSVPIPTPTPPSPSVDWSDPDAPPRFVGGYRILQLLGTGGMGRVFEAEDPEGRRVAVKLIRNRLSTTGTSGSAERFRREGRLASLINHPRCVFVVAADEQAGHPYIVMELMHGGTLEDKVRREGPLEALDAVRKTLDLIDGLSEAHKLGVLHRDVKPSNCYLDHEGRVKVGDFGLSRTITADLELTHAGGFVGTVLFSSPEQLKGERLDVRADVYSVAATLYWLVTGQAPFGDSQGLAAVARAVSEPAPSPRSIRPAVPEALERIILKGLERDKAKRYQNLDEFRVALEALLPVRATTAGLGRRIWAYLIDGCPLVAVGITLGFRIETQWSDVITPSQSATLLTLVQTALTLAYFGFFEGLTGATPGKWLTRLRVTRSRSETPRPPGLARGWLRIMIFAGLESAGVELISLMVPERIQRTDDFIFGSILAWLLGFVALFAPMRKRNGYRGLHEWLSGTRVIQLPPRPHPGRLMRRLGRLRRVDSPGQTVEGEGRSGIPRPSFPPKVGPFTILGAVRGGGPRLLLGEDGALGRRVWLHLRADGAAGPGPERRKLARLTRLRWIASGTTSEGQAWDAYIAPVAWPLRSLVSSRSALHWADARKLLGDLAEELAASSADGTLPSRLHADRVWVTPSGRLLLLDDLSDGDEAKKAGAGLAPLGLLADVASLALEGRTRARAPKPWIRAAVPQPARGLLDRLAGLKSSFHGVHEFRQALDELAHCPSAVLRGNRAAQLSIFAGLAAPALVGLLLAAHAPPLARLLELESDALRTEGLERAWTDPALRTKLAKSLPPILADNPETVREGLADYQRKLTHGETAVRKMLGPFRLVTMFDFRSGGIETEPGEIEFRQWEETTDEQDEKTDEWLIAVGRPGRPWLRELKMSQSRAAFEILARVAPEEARKDTTRAPRTALERGEVYAWVSRSSREVIAWLVGLALALSLVLGPGLSPSFRLAGLAAVRSDGLPCGRVRWLWRSLLFWTVPTAILTALILVENLRPDLPWSFIVLRWAYLGVLLGYAGTALRFPNAGPHDYLAGTRIVPR